MCIYKRGCTKNEVKCSLLRLYRKMFFSLDVKLKVVQSLEASKQKVEWFDYYLWRQLKSNFRKRQHFAKIKPGFVFAHKPSNFHQNYSFFSWHSLTFFVRQLNIFTKYTHKWSFWRLGDTVKTINTFSFFVAVSNDLVLKYVPLSITYLHNIACYVIKLHRYLYIKYVFINILYDVMVCQKGNKRWQWKRNLTKNKTEKNKNWGQWRSRQSKKYTKILHVQTLHLKQPQT